MQTSGDGSPHALDAKPDGDMSACNEGKSVFRLCQLTYGGDWEWLAKLLGLTGPNGKHYCLHCKTTLQDLEKGTPHALDILPKYRQPEGNDGIQAPFRTLNECRQQSEAFIDAGRITKDASQYLNCIYNPIICGEGNILDCVSTTPLHISLGLGKQIIDILEKQVGELDAEVRDSGVVFCDEVRDLYSRKEALLEDKTRLEEQKRVLGEEKQERVQTIEAVIRGNLDHFERVNGRLVCNTAVARDSRKQVAELKRDVKEVEVRIKSTEKEVAAVDKLQLEIQEATCKVKGPFKERFDAVIDELRLKRAAYHSGAFVGSDINKVFKLKNIPKFGHIFKPLTILGVSFSSCTLRVKITCLLNKFRLCYNLYTANRPLCKARGRVTGTSLL